MAIIQAFRRAGVDTVVTFPGLDVTNGNFITGATWTVTGGGAAINAATTQAAVDGSTAVAEDGSTGIYNFTIKAADNDTEKTVFKLDPNTANVESVVVILETVLYVSHINVTSATATQSAVSLTGNTTGAGISATGGATGAGIKATGGATSGPGMEITGVGTGNGATITGGATGNGVNLIGGGTSGRGLNITTTDGHGVFINGLGATGRAVYAASNAHTALELVAGGNNAGLIVTGAGTGNGATITSGAGATGNGVNITAASTNGNALRLTATGTGLELTGSGNPELTAVPGATPTIGQMIQFLFQYAKNKLTTTATTTTLYKDDSGTALGTQTLSDDGTTFTRTKMS